MANVKKIPYYDLRLESKRSGFSSFIGRKEEAERLSRVVRRRINNNALIVGQSGIGKTTFIHGWARHMAIQEINQKLQLIQLDPEYLHALDFSDEATFYQEALATLPPCILVIDDFGRAVMGNSSLIQKISRLHRALLKKPEVRMILALEPQELSWLEREHPTFLQSFEILTLKSQSVYEYVGILQSVLSRLNIAHSVVPSSVLKEIVSYAQRFPTLGQLPRSAVSLLDEGLATASATAQKDLTLETVQTIVAGRVGIPKTQLQANELENLKNLETRLNEGIVGQSFALKTIAATLTRAKLGVRNPHRPLGSFLMLGPSGVGKTETAKLVAELVFGKRENFTRFDMSEFGQEHTVQRLIGAPSGYIGYEAGGALTNALRAEPYSLVLLDEIEKAHPKVFDIFLQVLDDGRITSGKNEVVDVKNSVIMATSNVAVSEIVEAFNNGTDISTEEFLRTTIMPALSGQFRLEFLNRFDAIVIFNPLTLPVLLEIAKLEIKKVEQRLSKYNVRFQVDPGVLESRVKALADSRFGARPVKRFIEETCESLLVKSLLNSK